MAEKRMFAKTIIDSDAFLDMPLSTQALYFHLSMRADDDGFVNNPRKIQRMIGGSGDDLKLLIAKRFILTFESGVVVIKHWLIHNTLKKDRYKPTVYQKELKELVKKDNKSYRKANDPKNLIETPILNGEKSMEPEWNQNGTRMEPQYSIDKYRLDKLSKDNMSSSDEHDRIPYQEIIDYLNQKANKSYRHSTKKTKDLIKARVNDGFELDDFKKVIDNKCSDWLKAPKWNKFLRPETLFGNKFESYLNEEQKGELFYGSKSSKNNELPF